MCSVTGNGGWLGHSDAVPQESQPLLESCRKMRSEKRTITLVLVPRAAVNRAGPRTYQRPAMALQTARTVTLAGGWGTGFAPCQNGRRANGRPLGKSPVRNIACRNTIIDKVLRCSAKAKAASARSLQWMECRDSGQKVRNGPPPGLRPLRSPWSRQTKKRPKTAPIFQSREAGTSGVAKHLSTGWEADCRDTETTCEPPSRDDGRPREQ